MKNFIRNISRFLSKESIQRACYFFFMCLFTLAWYFDDISSTPVKKIDYTLIFPLVFLAAQVVLNNNFLWTIIFSMGVLYCTLLAGLTVKELIQFNQESGNIFVSFSFNVFSWALLWMLYKMKPAALKNKVA